MAPRIRVILADDHSLIRDGIRKLLDLFQDMEVVGEACDGSIAVNMVHCTRPDVVVMDISMPNLNGIDATEAIHLRWPEVKVIALSSYTDPIHVQAMLQAGAMGFVTKDNVFDDLPTGIRAVAHGKSYFSQPVRKYDFIPQAEC